MATDHPTDLSGDIEDITAGISGLLGTEVESSTNNVPISVVKTLLLKHESCEAWREGLPVTQEELDIVLQTISAAFEDFAHRTDENETDLRYAAVEMVARRCIQALIYLSKEVEEVESVLTEAHQLMQYCLRSKYIPREYEDGLRYVLKSLEYSLDIAKSDGFWSAAKLAELKGHLESYDTLSVKNRAGVLALKQYVLGNLSHGAYMEQLEVAKKMVELDPDNTEWHYCLHLVERYKREAADKYGPVTQEEKDTILRAMLCPGASQDPRILNGYISCLADIVRNAARSRSYGPFRLGTKTFISFSEVVTLIRSYADTILAIDPMSVRSNVNIAKIFSSVLPRDYRDKDFARLCLKRALIFRPNSSKANHRLGVLYLTSGEPLKALKYMKKAYETDNRNFFALMDCLNLLMADVKDNATLLDEYFSSSLDRSYFRRISKNHTSLVLLKALYEYLMGNKGKSMNFFYEAFIQHADRTKEFVLELPSNCSRFGWERNAHGGDLLAGLRSAFYQEFTASQDPTRKRVFSALHETAGAAGGRRAGPGRTGGWDRGFHHGGGPRGGFGRSRENEQQRKQYYGSSGTGNERGDEKKKHYSQPAGVTSDPYTLLGVSRGATKLEIKQAYRKMAMVYHPDKNRDVSQEEMLLKQEKMKLINKAWETLQG